MGPVCGRNAVRAAARDAPATLCYGLRHTHHVLYLAFFCWLGTLINYTIKVHLHCGATFSIMAALVRIVSFFFWMHLTLLRITLTWMQLLL